MKIWSRSRDFTAQDQTAIQFTATAITLHFREIQWDSRSTPDVWREKQSLIILMNWTIKVHYRQVMVYRLNMYNFG